MLEKVSFSHPIFCRAYLCFPLSQQGTVMFLMRQRIYNTRYYVTKEKRTATGSRPQAHPKDHQKLYQNLNVELKRKKANFEYIKQLMELTFKDRRKTILEIDDRDPSAAVLETFPFLNQELAVSSICPGTKERYDGSHGGYRGRGDWRGWRTCRSQVTPIFLQITNHIYY